jgi:hypothetical protein
MPVKKLSGMAALLTCSWVLWQIILAGNQMMRNPVTGYETRAKCLNQARQSMQPSKTMQRTSEGLLRNKDGFLYSYTCLPDTVKP